jgi:hypothetical protein
MFDAAMIADLVHDQGDGDRGHNDDDWQSPLGDLASSITLLEGHAGDNCDLCDIIRDRDAHGWIESRHRVQERDEQEQHDERDHDYGGPYYDQPHQQHSLKGQYIPGGIKAYS